MKNYCCYRLRSRSDNLCRRAKPLQVRRAESGAGSANCTLWQLRRGRMPRILSGKSLRSAKRQNTLAEEYSSCWYVDIINLTGTSSINRHNGQSKDLQHGDLPFLRKGKAPAHKTAYSLWGSSYRSKPGGIKGIRPGDPWGANGSSDYYWWQMHWWICRTDRTPYGWWAWWTDGRVSMPVWC